MLGGFRVEGQRQPSVREIEQKIDAFLLEKRLREKMNDKGDVAEGDQPNDPIEEGKVQDRQRRFLNKLRPHEQIWNFIQDDKETEVEHVIRADADPNQAYIDGRVANLLELIRGLGTHLTIHNEPGWQHINSQTAKIFIHTENEVRSAFEAWQKEQEEAAQR